MASKRMISQKIIDTDYFIEMPMSARLLYYELNWRADDDGFVDKPKTILRIVGCSDDDLKLLIAKKYVIPFESGVCVIRHWLIHNHIRNDRYTETKYTIEKDMLLAEQGKEYELNIGMTNDIPPLTKALSKSKTKSLPKPQSDIKNKYGKYENVLLTEKEYDNLLLEPNGENAIEYLSEYIILKNYKTTDHNLAIRKWVLRAVRENIIKEQELQQREQRLKNVNTNNRNRIETEDKSFEEVMGWIEEDKK